MKKKRLGIFISAVVLSVFIWLQSKLLTTHIVTVTSAIQYDNPAFTETSKYPAKINYRIQGLGLDLLKFSLNNVKPSYEPTEFSKDLDFNVEDVKFNLPNSIVLIDIFPVEKEIRKESQVAKSIKVPIHLVFTDSETQRIYTNLNYKLSQDSLELRGNAQSIRYLRYVKTTPISKDLLSKNKVRVKIALSSEDIKVQDEPIYIIRGSNIQVTKVITSVPIKSMPVTEFFPKSITIRIRGYADLLETITNNDFVVVLDERNTNSRQIPIKVSSGLDIEILGFSPAYVILRD